MKIHLTFLTYFWHFKYINPLLSVIILNKYYTLVHAFHINFIDLMKSCLQARSSHYLYLSHMVLLASVNFVKDLLQKIYCS